jgi:carbon-monoxide dehydrogenase large subunit
LNVFGQRILRKEDPRFLTGQGRFVDNLELEGALHATFVRSPFAHARVGGVDVDAARELPGVQVFTAADVDLPPFGPPPFPGIEQKMARPMVAGEVVRYTGDIVAVVLSEDRRAGIDAAELVFADYEPLPVAVTPEDALRDEVLLFPEIGTNVCARVPLEDRDEHLFDGCDAVVSGRMTSTRMAPSPLEPRATAARWGEDGRLTIWLSTQTPHQDRFGLAGLLGLDPGQIRVIAPDVGGGFGAKMLAPEDVLVAWLARKTGRPVRWAETRSESMVALTHGRGQILEFTIGGSKDGTVRAYRLNVVQDAGAYPAIGSFLPNLTKLMASGVYAIPKIEFEGVSVVTNTSPIGAFRGAGRPEATQAIERAMDMFAAEIGVDPAEVRRRNFIPNDAFPHVTVTGAPYDVGDYARALDLVLDTAGYDDLRAEQKRRRDARDARLLGLGLSTYVEVTNGIVEEEFGTVEITPDGEAILYTGSFSHGQGHETTFAMLVAERLGIPLDKIHFVAGDTDRVPQGTGTYGSKSLQIGGTVAAQAAVKVVEKAKRLVADELEAAESDVVLDTATGRFHVAGAPEPALSWADLAGRLDEAGKLGELRVEESFKAPAPTFPFGAHLAVVEVDTETGAVSLDRIVAVDDAGHNLNPLVAEGQVHGGLGAGVAQALYEEFTYDPEGNPLTASFLGYTFPSAAELPFYELIEMETPTPVNELGVKGIGESGTIGATPAVQNAVVDALAGLGVKHVEMPVNGENVWRAIEEARA